MYDYVRFALCLTRMEPSDISIAITCHRRLEFLEEALTSALRQTRPVNVWLQDNGCDRPEELDRIRARCGARLGYRRTPGLVSIFGNMNDCIAACPTPWLSILHDDDALAPDFVARIVAVSAEAPAALYFGGTRYISARGAVLRRRGLPPGEPWRRVDLADLARTNLFAFPGQLLHVGAARALGGFTERARHTGDWDLWFRLALLQGAVQLGGPELGIYRCHGGVRETVELQRAGRKIPSTVVQARVNFARLRRAGGTGSFDRRQFLQDNPLRYRETVLAAAHWSGRMLRYHRRMLLDSPPRSRAQAWIHGWTRLTGGRGLWLLARACAFVRSARRGWVRRH